MTDANEILLDRVAATVLRVFVYRFNEALDVHDADPDSEEKCTAMVDAAIVLACHISEVVESFE